MQNYLQRFVKDLNLTDDAEALPETWQGLASLTPEQRTKHVIDMWSANASFLSNTIHYLQQNLKGIYFAQSSRGRSLIYQIGAPDGSDMFYEGLAPAALPSPLASHAPSQLKKMYADLHGGWYYFSSQTMGWMPPSKLFSLSEKQWPILASQPKLELDLHQCLAIFNNGMGDYLCWDSEHQSGVLWFHDRPAKTNIDFWAFFDSWLCVGFE